MLELILFHFCNFPLLNQRKSKWSISLDKKFLFQWITRVICLYTYAWFKRFHHSFSNFYLKRKDFYLLSHFLFAIQFWAYLVICVYLCVWLLPYLGLRFLHGKAVIFNQESKVSIVPITYHQQLYFKHFLLYPLLEGSSI